MAPSAPARGPPSPPSSGEPKVKRARTSKPKVKTGCVNCKLRRIKCDEKRPSCTQCVRSKKMCTGYPPPARSAWPFEEIKIAPKPSQVVMAAAPMGGLPPAAANNMNGVSDRRQQKMYQRRNTPPHTPVTAQSALAPLGDVIPQNAVILYHPSTGLGLDHGEGLYFQLFRDNTANELSGFFDNVFWSRTVMQECHSEPAIRHAVVALGALYKTLEKSTESPPGSPTADMDPVDNAFRHWEVALKQYSNACRTLASAAVQDSRTQRTRLMASVLLACFDSFIGDHKQAIVQIQTGLGLLEQLRAERRRAFMPKPEEPVEDELIQMFTRLAIQAKSYDMAFHFPQPYVIHLLPTSTDPSSPSSDGGSPVSTHQEPIPDRFATLLEARISWDTLCERIFRFTETMFQYAHDTPNILPSHMTRYGVQFKTQIEAWAVAFEPLLASRTGPGVSSQEKAGIAVLKMFQIMGQILYLMTFSDSEMRFDNFQPQFQAIVDLALEVVGDEERRAAAKKGCTDPRLCYHHNAHTSGHSIFGAHELAAKHIKPSFSADLGIVPPLYVVATKSRDRVVRRQAIQLLRSSARREGMWDSELAARIGIWVAEIEEEETEPLLVTPGSSPADIKLDAPPPVPDAYAHAHAHAHAHANGYLAAAADAEVPLGPGGNARWDARRESQAAMMSAPRRPVPAEKRVLIKACEFDLREHTATLQCGTRGLASGTPDLKTRVTQITW